MGIKRKRPTQVRDLREERPRSTSPSGIAPHIPDPAFSGACWTTIDTIRQILNRTMGTSWTVVAQGSFVQGLQLRGSDLDLVLLDGTDRWRHLNRDRTADELDRAVRAITRASRQGYPVRVNVIKKIYRARVPLAKLRVHVLNQQQQIEVDMCFGDPSRGSCDHFVSRLLSSSRELKKFVLTLKIWAKERGITTTHTGGISCFAIVLLAIFFYQHHGPRLKQFFEWFVSIRSKTTWSVCVESGKLESRPRDATGDLLHVAVPCRGDENAARCLNQSVWSRKLFPEINRAIAVCGQGTGPEALNMDLMLDKLINSSIRADVFARNNAHLEFLESDSELEAPEWSDDEGNNENAFDNVLSSSSSSSSPSDEQPSVLSNQTEQRQAPKATPIQIHECSECEYFSFNIEDLHNHKFAVHKFRNSIDDVQETVSSTERYRMPRNYKRRTHQYGVVPSLSKKQKRYNEGDL